MICSPCGFAPFLNVPDHRRGLLGFGVLKRVRPPQKKKLHYRVHEAVHKSAFMPHDPSYHTAETLTRPALLPQVVPYCIPHYIPHEG